MLATVRELNIFPVKSAHGITVRRAPLTATGLAWDRHWMFTRPEGTFITQRTHPHLARIRPSLGAALVLEAAGHPALSVPLQPQGPAVQVRIWKDRCTGLDQGDAAAAWASAVLGEPLRMMRIAARPDRIADQAYAGPAPAPVGFADGFPLLVCNSASLEELNRRLPAPIPMNRFRPNLVLDGLPPFAEDHIARLYIGKVCLQLVKPCTRCVIPSQDQDTGEPDVDPTPALKQFRFDHALKGVTFGENAVPVAGVGEELAVGATCEVELDAGANS